MVTGDERRAELSRRLWGDSAEASSTGDVSTVVEQYKLYVEMADRVSQRRALANTFFLSLNTKIVALIGAVWTGGRPEQPWWLVVPLVALEGECFAWFYLVRSYRLLNAAKYEVVGALEERLPGRVGTRAATGRSATSSSGSLVCSGSPTSRGSSRSSLSADVVRSPQLANAAKQRR